MNRSLPTDWSTRFGVLILLAALACYIVWPMLAVAIQSVSHDPGAAASGYTLDHWRAASTPANLRALWTSLWLSLASTALAGVVGGGLAVFYTRWSFPGRAFYAAVAVLPLTLPPLVGVFAFWRMLSETGLPHRLLHNVFGVSLSLERGWGGVLLVHAYSFSVYFYMMLASALRSMDGSTLEAARNLGAGWRRRVFGVALPQLTPALVGASLLVFMSSMASFTAPWIYVRARDVLTLNIARAYQDSRYGQAAILCLFMIAASFAILVALLWWNARTNAQTLSKGVPPRRVHVMAPVGRWGLSLLGAVVTLALAAPHLYLLFESFIQPQTWFQQALPPAYTLDNYAAVFREPDFLRPIVVSLKASGAATIGVTVFGLLAAWLVARKRFLGRRGAALLVMLPWALPGTVIAINLLEAFDRPSGLTFGLRLHGTVAILALAYFIRYLPLTYRSTLAAIETLDPNLELAARNLGAGRARTLIRVVLPLIAPGLLAGALLAFVTALGEFVSSILLYVRETMPIAVKINELLRFNYEIAAAYSVLLIGLILIVLLFSARFLKTGAFRL